MKFSKIKLPFKVKKPILALGANTKNTVCFAEGTVAYLSPVYAHLDSPHDFREFERTVRYWLRRGALVVAYDLHLGYQSTKYAERLASGARRLIPVQHHHAHIASCMAENGLRNQKVIGVAFDGTGLGSDGQIWGAEFFLCDYRDFKRVAHLKEIPLLGGEKAILEPQRLVFAWFYPNLQMGQKKIRLLGQLYRKRINSPYTSSMGRLFDAAGSMILNRPSARYEGELPIELEKAAALYSGKAEAEGNYKFKLMKNDTYIIDPLPVLKAIIRDRRDKKNIRGIAYKFHLAVAVMIKDVCLRLRKDAKINTLVLSGGVFQNKLLLSLARGLLTSEGFSLFTHQDFSSSDSSLSLGQVVLAAHRSIF